MIGKIFSAAIVVGAIVYGGYVLMGDSPCDRVERSTVPIQELSDLLSEAAKPWNKTASVKLKLWGLKARLGAVKMVKHQFYYDRNVTCGWENVDLSSV